MKTDEIREKFLSFFESKGCARRPSDVLVPQGDPTLLFTGAGMNQFKEQFLAIGQLDFTRATTCQKCLRTGDIDNVGRTRYHDTFFEMLGNFSFGDYFKREAIVWAWEFLLEHLKLPAERLTASVYKDDDEAFAIWHDEVGLPPDRIARYDEDENYWPASAPSQGPNGVCGPCSEIFYNEDDGTEVEIWNLVFTQFDRQDGGVLKPLPNKNIDTGMGLERTAAVMQGVRTVFDTDIFTPITDTISRIVDRRYGPDAPEARRIRRIADHVRAVAFCVTENVFPSNEKQGYVVRRLLRRAVLDAYRLGVRDSRLHELVPVVGEVMKGPYPEVLEHAERTGNIIRLEEERFLDTLEVGTRYLDSAVDRLVASGQKVLSGDDAFRLHDTYGFPLELTEQVLHERGLAVDRTRYEVRMEAQRDRSRAGTTISGDIFVTGPLDQLKSEMNGTDFVGYDTTQAEGTVRGIIVGDRLVECLSAGSDPSGGLVVLDRSPFYGEVGGQVGDTGTLRGEASEFRVDDTRRDSEFMLHVGEVTRGRVAVGDTVRAAVDTERRQGIRRAHTGTHLLHHALRKHLGSHAMQKGSLVECDRVRFDFTHFQAVTRDQLGQIEDEVNRRIMDAAPVHTDVMPLDEARKSGAVALFGEKYGDQVRVVRSGDFSTELCGGTHLANTGHVGLCKIISEESIAAGTRRITALTGPAALAHVHQTESVVQELSGLLKVPAADLAQRATAMLGEIKAQKAKLARGGASAGPTAGDLLAGATQIGETKLVAVAIDNPDLDPRQLRTAIDQLRKQGGSVAAMLGMAAGGKVQLLAGLTRDLTDKGLDAVDWVRAAAKVVGGGGGGRPDMAQAGGKDPSRLSEALAEAVNYIRAKLDA